MLENETGCCVVVGDDVVRDLLKEAVAEVVPERGIVVLSLHDLDCLCAEGGEAPAEKIVLLDARKRIVVSSCFPIVPIRPPEFEVVGIVEPSGRCRHGWYERFAGKHGKAPRY